MLGWLRNLVHRADTGFPPGAVRVDFPHSLPTGLYTVKAIAGDRLFIEHITPDGQKIRMERPTKVFQAMVMAAEFPPPIEVDLRNPERL